MALPAFVSRLHGHDNGVSVLLARMAFFDVRALSNVHDTLIQLAESKSADILINFLKVLQILSLEDDYQLLSSPDFALRTQDPEENRLQKVIKHISINYNKNISLDEIAGIASMTPPAFCRFFQGSTNKTFSHFLNEFRISKACQLLIDGEQPIKQICYDVGFNSLTNFNRTFRWLKHSTPSTFRASYRQIRD